MEAAMRTVFRLAKDRQTFVFELDLVNNITLSPVSIIFSIGSRPDWNIERSVFVDGTNFIFQNNTTSVHTAFDARLILAVLSKEGWQQIS